MEQQPVLPEYGVNADLHWEEIMALAKKYGFIYHSAGGLAILMTHKLQLSAQGEREYLRIQKMNGHCPKTFGYAGCLDEDGSLKECDGCEAAQTTP